MGFAVELVLADSLYGESTSTFIRCLQQKNYHFIVSIRSNHGVWLPEEQMVRANKWRPFERRLAGNKEKIRYIREIIFGNRQELRYWEITTNPKALLENDTWYVMSWIPKIKYSDVGNLYGCRSWIEHSFNYIKNQLGWADFRLANYMHIEKWWELVCSAYCLISLNANAFSGRPNYTTAYPQNPILKIFSKHYQWNDKSGWKNCLNNLRLLMLPFVCFNLIQPWLKVFPILQLSLGFPRLIALINLFPYSMQPCLKEEVFYFSSA
jgi:SRSO17 transposase